MDPILSLSLTLQSNKGCFGVLLGSGVSRSAGIPTGWEVVLDLVKRLAHLSGEDCEPDPAAWFQSKYGHEPDYSELLEQIAKSPTERSQLLRPFFEPTDEEKQDGIKLPTQAHRSIAKLVKAGYVKVIVTTNFDKLMEQALHDEGVNPQILASPDAIEGALPIAHSACTIIKVHGDYLDTRIKNAPAELEKYDSRVNGLLDRVLDEYGLIVSGWSGDWDAALRAAIERCKGRRFSTYWVAHGEPSDKAKSLIQLRSASVISSLGADEFFSTLEEKLVSLNEMSNQDPVSAKLAVATLKRYLVSDESRIRLEDFVRNEQEAAYQSLANPKFLEQPCGHDGAAYKRKLEHYAIVMEITTSLMINGCYWGNKEHVALWKRTLERFAAIEGVLIPFTAHPDLRMYPTFLLLYGGGIASILSNNFETLDMILTKANARGMNDETFPVSFSCMDSHTVFDVVGNLKGLENRHRPLSDYLHQVLRVAFTEIEPDDHVYDLAFDKFEAMLALAIGNMTTGSPNAPAIVPLTVPMPVGRFGWRRNRHRNVIEILKQEQAIAGECWPPFQVGMFGGDVNRFNALMGTLESRVAQLMWN